MERIAVIDTETNLSDEVMSIGIVIASSEYLPEKARYYVFPRECGRGAIYYDRLLPEERHMKLMKECPRSEAMRELAVFLRENGVRKLFAYNAKFDRRHLEELAAFEWYDIMRLAAYRQYNRELPPGAECCRSGRLRTDFGVEPILRCLMKKPDFAETHNALYDAVDELRIMRLLKHSVEDYAPALIK